MIEINKLSWCLTTSTGCRKEVSMLPIKSAAEFKDFVDQIAPEKKKPLTPIEFDALVKIISDCQAGGKTLHA